MKRHPFLVLLILAAAACAASAQPANAQDDPFGDNRFDAGPATDLVEPAEAVPVAQPVEDNETNPAVAAILEGDPQSPRELVKAADLMSSLGRPAHSKAYLATLLTAGLDDLVLSELQRQFGSGLFLRMIRNPDLQPEGGEFGTKVLDAGYRAARNPQRISALIAKLNGPNAAPREAIRDLELAGDAAVSALIGVLADSKRADEAAGVRTALAAFGSQAAEGLVAAMQSDNRWLRANAAQVLGRMSSRASIPYLLAPALADADQQVRNAAAEALHQIVGRLPNGAESARFLEERIAAATAARALEPAEREAVDWVWDPAQQTAIRATTSARQSTLRTAARLASQLYQLDQGDPRYRKLYFATHLELAQLSAGLDERLPTAPGSISHQLAGLGTAGLQEMLAFVVKNDYTAAAIAVVDLMGQYGTVELLLDGSGRETGLAKALRHPDRRLRFAAVRAIAELNPDVAFPGSSQFPAAIAYFTRTAGTRRGLVVHPRIEQSQSIVAILGALGVESDAAQTSREGYKKARHDGDYELILVSDGVDQPPVGELLQQLRSDPLTAALPVGIMAQSGRLAAALEMAENDPLTEAFPTPTTMAQVSLFANRLLALRSEHHVPYEVRVRQAHLALRQLLHLASNSERYPFYDLPRSEESVEHVLFNSRLAAEAAPILGYLGTPAAQRALVTVASQNSRQLSIRQAAATAFDTAVQRRGLLLTREEILLQYTRYNQSAQLDRETQLVLASVLDAIERRTVSTQIAEDSPRADS